MTKGSSVLAVLIVASSLPVGAGESTGRGSGALGDRPSSPVPLARSKFRSVGGHVVPTFRGVLC